MKRVLAWMLLLVMVLGMFAGCKPKEDPTPTTDPVTTAPQQSGVKGPGAQDAIDYLKSLYQDDGTETPVDYNRYGIVRVGGIEFMIEWSVDVAEDLVKIVVNEDGTVTVDINEQCEEATPYVLTATITDENGNTATHSWNHILPKAQDMVEIVKAAYALANGESLPYQSRLIGKIVSIDSIWSDEYQNITVTIEVEGAEDMPIKCYRMKGNDNTITVIKDLKVGNIITVLGILKNYEGTIEFDAGCILEKVEKGDAVDAPTDPGEILKAAYALKKNEALPYQATLTGRVIEIDSPYDPNYGNISVVIEVEGYPQYPMLCYRMKGTGVDEIAIDDLITVTGIIKNYNGTIEYDAGCMMIERISGGGVAQKPSSDAAKILADAAKLGVGEKLPYRATLTGEIVSVDNAYDPNYGNVTVTIKVNGVKIQCYRMVGDGIDQIRETDTITVTGVIENYNGKLEFGAKCNLDSWEKGPRNVNYGSLKEGVAYRLYMDQKATGNTVYFNGEVKSNRLQTTTTGSKGVDVYAERHGKGLRFYFMDGETKTYIEIEEFTNDEGKQRGGLKVTTEPSCYWVYNSDCGVYIVNLPTAGKYFLGTYGTYETISASWIGYIDGSYSGGSTQYVAKFIEASKVQDGEPSDTIVQGTAVENPAVGTAYKFGYYQNQVEGKPFLAFNGKMAGWYYGTADAIANMVDVYLEEADGGYHIYFMDGNTKTYLDIVPRDNDATKVNVVMQTSGKHTVWSLNLEHKYVYATEVGSEWYLGTFGTNTSISASLTSYISDTSLIGVSQFCAWFSEVEEVEAPEPTDPEPSDPQPSEPAGTATLVTQPVYATAYKLGVKMPDGTIMYLTGATADVNYRLAISANVSEAADFYLEEVPGQVGGAYLYFMNGNTKTYVRVYHRTDGDPGYGKGSLELVTSAPSEFFGWSVDANTLIYDYDGNNAYYMGTYDYQGTIHDDVSVSNTYYITGNNASKVDVTQFPVRFYTVEESGDEPDVTEPDVTEPSVEVPTYVTSVEAGKEYKLGFVQGSNGNVLMFFNGEVANKYYGGSTESWDDAVTVVLETANGGYYLSYTKADGTKMYVNVVASGTYTNFTMAETASSVYTFDTEYNTLVTNLGDKVCYLGTYNTYNTFSASTYDKISNATSYPARLYVMEESTEPEVTEPEVTEPEVTEPEVTEPTVSGDGYIKVTSEAEFTSGQYVMIVSTGYAPGVYENKWLTAVQPVVSGNTVTDPAGGVWTLTVNGSTVTITDANGVAVKPKGGNNNGILDGSYEWSWSFEDGTFTFHGTGSDTVVLASNTSTDPQYGGFNRFRGYKNTTISNSPSDYPCAFTLYKLSEGTGVEPEVTEPEVTEPEATEPEATNPDVSEPAIYPFVIVAEDAGVAMTTVAQGSTYGYLPKTDVTVVDGVLNGITADNVFYMVTIEEGDDYAIVYMVDYYGRVLYMTGTYNSCNFSDEIPAEGAEWKLTLTEDGRVYITNILMNKTVGYSAEHGSFGVYPDASKHTALLLVPVTIIEEDPDATEPEATEPEATEPTAGSSATYSFANYTAAAQYEDVTRQLDDVVSVSVTQCHFTKQIRIYQDDEYDGNAVFTSTKAIKSIVLNAGHKASDLKVYGSVDGENWVEVDTVSIAATTTDVTTYGNYTVEMPAGTSYKYLKLDAVSAQIRIANITFNFAE